jgi:elongation factor Ts
MTEITAALVKELRDRTGAGMMECKRALVQSAGDMEAAVEGLRKSGLAKAVKRAGKTAAEGIIAIRGDPAGHSAAMVEVNCETDFVAKGEDFQSYARAVAGVVLAHRPKDLGALMAVPIEAGTAATVEIRRQELSARIGENINVRRFSLMENPLGLVAHYLHGTRIGVLVEVVGGDAGLARDIAMHIAASRPVCVSDDQVPRLSRAASRPTSSTRSSRGRSRNSSPSRRCWVSPSSRTLKSRSASFSRARMPR